MSPNEEAVPGKDGNSRKSLRKEDGGTVTGEAPASKQIQCLYCQQPNVFHLEGGEDE